MRNLLKILLILFVTKIIHANVAYSTNQSAMQLFIISQIEKRENKNVLSRRWLYAQAARSHDFTELNQVKKNKNFFIDIISDHINYLENQKKIKAKKVYRNKLAKGTLICFCTIEAALQLYLCKEEFKYFTNIKQKIRTNIDSVLLITLISTVTYGFFLGTKLICRAFEHQKTIPYKLARDRDILEKLEKLSLEQRTIVNNI